MSPNPQEDKDKDIQDILSGLDDILQDIVNSKQQAPAQPNPAASGQIPKAEQSAPGSRAEPKVDPPTAAASSAPPTEKIEIPNRGGMPPAGPKVDNKAEESRQEKKGLPSQPGSVEIRLDSSKAPAAPSAPKPIPTRPSEPPRPAPVIPANASKDQIRRIAFLYAPEQKNKCKEFSDFIGNVAEKVSKKPLYIQKVLDLEVMVDANPNAVLNQVKTLGAVGALGVLEGLKDAQIKDIEQAFENADFFLRLVPAADVAKRTMAIDLVVDLMLLKSG